MTQKEFIDKWNVGYEDLEQKKEFEIQMVFDLTGIIISNKMKAYIDGKYSGYCDIANSLLDQKNLASLSPEVKDICVSIGQSILYFFNEKAKENEYN